MARSDSDLLARASSGDRHALAVLLKEHGAIVRQRFAGRIPRRWQSVLCVDDLMQQTYIDAFLDIDRFVPQRNGSFGSWLTKLAECNLVDAIRMLEADKRGKDSRQVEAEACGDTCMALHERLSVSHSTPSRHVARDEACASLNRAIEQLPDDYRTVVQLYDLDGVPIGEVARRVHRKPGAVFMIRARAHRCLRELMGAASQYLTTT